MAGDYGFMDALCFSMILGAISLATVLRHAPSHLSPSRDLELQPEIDWRVEPISGELRLLDLIVPARGAGEAGVEVAIDSGGMPSERVIRMGSGTAGREAVWRVRLMGTPGGDDAGSVRFWLRPVGEVAWSGPFQAAASPLEGSATPAWALGAVWYQVFPERFANGNRKNDPEGPGVSRRAWGSAWASVTAAEIEAARARAPGAGRQRADAGESGSALYQVATSRRYGGDLEGVHQKLDVLADLGITALYFNPIFDAPSMHKYDAADYRHVDPTLAGDDPGERPAGEGLDPTTWRWTSADRFLIDTLLPAARGRGMRVVLDGVWNHTSTSFWAFRDVAQRGKSSPFAGWFQASFEGDRLSGWVGWPNRRNGSLPQFARGEDGNIVAPVRAHIADITRRWMDPDGDGDPSDGIDGWRLDVAPDIPTSFWREWCPLVRSINPEAVMIGETWFTDRDRIGDGMFHAQMNYPVAMAIVKWLDGREGFGAGEFRAAVEAASVHPARINLAQMNLLGSHDTARLATMLNNPGRGYGGREKIAAGAEDYRTERPPAWVYDLVVLGVAMQATLPGSPMVYGGDEWGVYGADDPDDRKPIPWPEAGPYDDPDERPSSELRERYRTWLQLRSDPEVGPVLRYGSLEWVETGSPEVVALSRRLNSKEVLIILNRDDAPFDAAALVGMPSGSAAGKLPGRSAGWWLVRK
jgi:cyclomaltodextrinase